MAKKVKNTNSIKSSEDLVTSRQETRAGFIAMALEKNYIAIPYIEEAKALKTLSSRAKEPKDLLKIKDLRVGLLTASGLSEKALNYLTEDDRTLAIVGLIEKFLEPAGDHFVDELVYRYLLTKGDALGGKARNLAGTLGERKFLRSLLSVFNISGIKYHWKDKDTDTWIYKATDNIDIENRIKALYWKKKEDRLMILNTNVPLVKKNVDLVILQSQITDLRAGKSSVIYQPDKYIALGELKGGIDPAGADEHWKTANTALNRIRISFGKKKLNPLTFFVGAAIENAMAIEIFKQLQVGSMNNAANLSNEEQLTSLCDWLINL